MAEIKKDKVAIPVIIILSVLVPLIVLVLMNLPERYNFLGVQVGAFPLFHAVLNGLTAVLLLMGFFCIRSGNRIMHRNMMISAFGLSAVFLISYVISKISNEPVPYGGEGYLRPIYFFILISHIVLSIAL